MQFISHSGSTRPSSRMHLQPHGARNDVRAAATRGGGGERGGKGEKEIGKKRKRQKREREREKEKAKRWNRSNRERWRRGSTVYIHIWLVFVG